MSGILTLLISIIFMGIIITFSTQYFNTLDDLQTFKNNKNNLSVINDVLSELKNASEGSYRTIYLEPSDTITINQTTNKITIKQRVKNLRFYEKQKDYLNYGSLDINKQRNNFIFTLDLNGIIDFNNTVNLMETKQNISFLIVNDQGIPTIKTQRVAEGNWYDSNWDYRKIIVLDSNYITSDLTNFPILVNFTSDDLKENAKEDGSDIVFTSADKTTKLYREIEDYNSDTGELVAWVNIPSLDADNDSYIYLYYGNQLASETNDTETWDDHFVMVQHLNNNQLDSTDNNIDGNITGSLTLTTDRLSTNNAYRFTNDNYITINDPLNQENLEQIWTVDAWYYIDDKDDYQTVVYFNRGCQIIYSTSGNPILYLNSSPNDYYTYGDGTQIDTNTWQKITFRFRNSDGYRKIYVNGVGISTSGPNQTSTPNGISAPIKIGGTTFRGIMDEVKISRIIRSDDWILTEYNTQNNPSSFHTIGMQEIR